MPDLYCWAATHVGLVRQQNEDALGLSTAFTLGGEGTWQGRLPGERVWAVVADGMGGPAAGEVASRLAVEVLGPFLMQDANASDLVDALAAADWAIREAMNQQPAFKGMGTTVCGVVAVGRSMSAFNVGDSRIYLLENGELRHLSEDHVIHGHILTQCLGGSSEGRTLAPCIFTQPLPADARLLLSSDGLTDIVPDEQIREILGRSERPAEELVEAALHAGGHDNVTAVVLQFEPS
ncbi:MULTISPECIES: PP2C family protein-serine/threonine phosphatase [Sphingomonas]|uniref:PP2C family protein-serine/threonine phosphatase n=1 Tax=Sphingomonas TaxID=13687 RepID=UPI00126A36A7|nr:MULTISPECIES: protein phosphatase 2C domain-containing protein [Sphingomonas]